MKTKTIAVEEEIWFKLRKLEQFPERSKVSDVIKWLLEEQQKGKDIKEEV